MLRNQDGMGRTNWATGVKSLLYRYGFGLVWLSQDFGNMKLFIMQFKQRLVDCHKQKWSNNVHESSRCDTYKHFKTILEPEKYLSFEIPHSHIKALARFRCSSHKFAIETGRHNNIPKTDRLCAFCLEKTNARCLEDEYHVFFKCKKYDQERTNYLYNWCTGNSGTADFYDLLSTKSEFKISKVANYVYHIMNRTL